MNRSRPMFLRQWPARRVLDNQDCELDACLPPSTDAILRGHEPVYQRPAPVSHWLAIVAAAFGIGSGLYIAASAVGVI